MKQIIKVGLVFASLAVLAAAAVAGPTTGIWHGYIKYDASKLPAETKSTHSKLRGQAAKNIGNARLTLTLNSNRTLSLLTFGLPTGQQSVTGTWSQAGDSIQMNFKKGASTEMSTYTMAKDGRSFANTQGPYTIMFFR